MSKTIFIIERDYYMGNLIKQFLASLGYKTVVSSTLLLEESLIQCKEMNPDCIVLDISTGEELSSDHYKQFQNLKIPTIVTSTRPKETVASHLGTNDFLFIPKPFDLQVLVNAIVSKISNVE